MDEKYCHANKPQYRQWVKNKNSQPKQHPDDTQYIFHGQMITQKMLGNKFQNNYFLIFFIEGQKCTHQI